MSQTTTDRILYALFCLSRDTRHIDATELARAAGSSALAAGQALLDLERAGLVDASRARLTMSGLARAARLSAAGSGQPRVELRHAKPRRTRVSTPLAAAPESVADEDDRLEREIGHGGTGSSESCMLQ
jgi:DNA-binding transcriptional ArsR family regulator